MPPPMRQQMVRSADVTLAVTQTGEPGAPAVVLIHGYPDTSAVWRPVSERLAADFQVIAYDVRGAGASTAPAGRDGYRLARLADDLEAVCDAVADGQPVHLVGHDWGAIQGWEFVCDQRFAGRIASYTAIAGPRLGDALAAARRGWGPATAWRSWYILPLCLPGGPTMMWRVALGGGRWRRALAREGIAVDDGWPAPTLAQDALNGANLYRANIMPRLLGRPGPSAGGAEAPHHHSAEPERAGASRRAHAPVGLIVPTGDRFIPTAYYERAARAAPGLRRRDVAGSHWIVRTEPALVAALITEFARG